MPCICIDAISLVYRFADVGTVVTIQNQVMQESGDLLIDAIGDRRFSVNLTNPG